MVHMGTNRPGGDLKVAKENKPNASWEIRGNKPKKEVDRDTFLRDSLAFT